VDNNALSLILTALTTGAAAGIKNNASQAVIDAYNGLKLLLQKKLSDRPTAEMALIEHEKKPDIWKAPLEEELKEIGADQDQDVIAAAQRLIKLVQPQQAAMGKYNIQTTGNVQNQIIGDHTNITFSYGDTPKK
jgi:DNA-binding SARP family transcriptional activator